MFIIIGFRGSKAQWIRRERDDRLPDLFDRCGNSFLYCWIPDGEGYEVKDCESCVHEYLSPMSDICRECGIAMLNYEERKPMTHFDEIKAMSVEELADWFCQTQYREGDFCPPKHGWKYCIMADGCRVCWLDWLKSPVDKEVDG